MKKLIRPLPFLIVFGVALLIAGANAVRTGILSQKPDPNASTLLPAGVQAIRWDGVKAAISNKSAIFLDVRPENAYREGHLPGALSLPFDFLPQRLEGLGLNANDHFILYCDGGDCHSSVAAARVLSTVMGFKNLKVYEGGWDDYSNRAGSKGALK
jgi:rhodanese-related sulfurtransferase